MMIYKTVLKPGEVQLEIQKSKFIGYVQPVTSEAEAVAFIEAIKKKHRDASHNVPVYLIGRQFEIQRYSDDGEPSGTAGVPVLDFLKKSGIINLCLVVTRYFGGVKLGTGGLVRAYTNTAQRVLETVGIVEMHAFERIVIEYDYTLHGKINNWLQNMEMVFVEETQYTDVVRSEILCPQEDAQKFADAYVELTNGQAAAEVMSAVYLPVKKGKRIYEY